MGHQLRSYIELVASRMKAGQMFLLVRTEASLYENPNYQAVPFAQKTLDSILSADPNNSTVEPSPYVGIQFAAIPEFAGIATEVSQEFSAAYAGQQTVEEALAKAQALTNDAMEAAGYKLSHASDTTRGRLRPPSGRLPPTYSFD